ncbi:hypothetical protein V6N11_025362 [Hibiscus sabdariffa]|uniref:Uncharacterized protein n=1 Tax=Hibiscus sabdariffa TaxID=183260 RepID=A0ABR1Z9G5_9ROSI
MSSPSVANWRNLFSGTEEQTLEFHPTHFHVSATLVKPPPEVFNAENSCTEVDKKRKQIKVWKEKVVDSISFVGESSKANATEVEFDATVSAQVDIQFEGVIQHISIVDNQDTLLQDNAIFPVILVPVAANEQKGFCD